MKSQGYRNSTAETATGKVEKEWRQMARLALFIRSNKCSPTKMLEEEKKFTGIFKRLLDDPIVEVEKAARLR